MTKRVVIVHDQMGIFIGASMGLAFWSMLETGGQWTAVCFEDENDAREFVAEWKPPQDPDEYKYVEIEAEREWATIAELTKAGLGERVALMLLHCPVEGFA